MFRCSQPHSAAQPRARLDKHTQVSSGGDTRTENDSDDDSDDDSNDDSDNDIHTQVSSGADTSAIYIQGATENELSHCAVM